MILKKPINKDTTSITPLESFSIPPATKTLASDTMCFPKNKLFPVKNPLPRVDLSAKVDNDDEDGVDYEDDDNGDEDDDDEDDDNGQLSNEKPRNIKGSNLSKETKSIINKFSQLFQESKRGAKQNRGKLMILLDLLKDCEIFDDKDYDKLYDAIENICDKY